MVQGSKVRTQLQALQVQAKGVVSDAEVAAQGARGGGQPLGASPWPVKGQHL